MKRYSRCYIVSWDKLHRDTKELAERLADKNYEGLLCVTRGGMIPSGIIARELNIRKIETICIASYDLQEQSEELTKLNSPAEIGNGRGWLIIDDLVDTGKTAAYLKEKYPEAEIGVVYVKPAGKEYVDYYIDEVTQDTWILFPWDSEIQFAEPIVKSRK